MIGAHFYQPQCLSCLCVLSRSDCKKGRQAGCGNLGLGLGLKPRFAPAHRGSDKATMAKKSNQTKIRDKAPQKIGNHDVPSGALSDPRFKAALTDPRFQRFPKSQRTVDIDERFEGASSDIQLPFQYKVAFINSSKDDQRLHRLHACHHSRIFNYIA